MSETLTLEQLRALRSNPDALKSFLSKGAEAKRRNKYNAIPTADGEGRVHPSKLQARVTDRIRGDAVAVIPEVSMPLSTRKNDRIRIDCLVIEAVNEDGSFRGRFVEVKGKDLGEGKQKRRRFEDAYGIPVEVVTK